MKFTLYEEFPTKSNLAKLTEIEFPIDVIIAAKSYNEFKGLKSDVKEVKSDVERVGYWPVLRVEDGYWMSPFSKRAAVEQVVGELEDRDDRERLLLHWDCELPWAVNRRLMLNFMDFIPNKKRIGRFLNRHKELGIDLVSSEFSLVGNSVKEALGISIDPTKYDSEKVIMFYTSLKGMMPRRLLDTLIRKILRDGVRAYEDKFGMAFGCLDTGILGNENIISPENFQRNLDIASREGLSRAYIFRLSGIKPDYLDIMRKLYKKD